MNPMDWKREHQTALLIAAVIGAVLGAMVSFILGQSVSSQTTTPFGWWLDHQLSKSWGWIPFGALLGAGIVYVRQLLNKSN